MSDTHYAKVEWHPEDVQSITGWPLDECEKFLVQYSNRIQDRVTELGFHVIADLIAMRGDEST